MQVLEDFSIRYSDQANPNALIERWTHYSEYAQEVATKQFKSGPLHTGWPKDIESFLVFIKLLPAKNGKNSAPGSILPFSLAIDKFIMHSHVRFLPLFIYAISIIRFLIRFIKLGETPTKGFGQKHLSAHCCSWTI